MNVGFYYNRIYSNKTLELKKKELSDKQHLQAMKIINDKLTNLSYEDIRLDTTYFQEERIVKSFSLKTLYPGLATGTGMGHEADVKGELKLGFYFDYTTGQPVIPGSTIKGVLRSAFPQWDNHKDTPKKKKWAKTAYIYMLLEKDGNETWDELRKKWDLIEKDKDETKKQKERIIAIEKDIFEGFVNEKNLPIYQRDIFYDAYISAGTIRKPIQGGILGTDSITPHVQEGMSYEASMLKNPTPIPFLKILPDVKFSFNFILHNHKKVNAGLLNEDEKIKLFKQILLDFGIGAKTNVGYGQFSEVK